MQIKKVLSIILAIGGLALVWGEVACADLINNGDFSNGLVKWSHGGDTIGDVNVNDDKEAVLSDYDDWYSVLSQAVSLSPSKYTIEFDFKNELSTVVPDDPSFALPDTFYASLFFTDDMASFYLPDGYNIGVFDDERSLFNMDFLGVFDNDLNPGPANGTLSTSLKGAEWTHFSYTFLNDHKYVVPVFELTDLNFINVDLDPELAELDIVSPDSQVLIDNVSINPVPEPSTILLLATGLIGLGGVARKKLKKASRGKQLIG